jgi:hypothetical protein
MVYSWQKLPRAGCLPQKPFAARIASEKNHFLYRVFIVVVSVLVMLGLAFLLSQQLSDPILYVRSWKIRAGGFSCG